MKQPQVVSKREASLSAGDGFSAIVRMTVVVDPPAEKVYKVSKIVTLDNGTELGLQSSSDREFTTDHDASMSFFSMIGLLVWEGYEIEEKHTSFDGELQLEH